MDDKNAFPFVSILISARNEEENIITCLSSIENIIYPKDRFEILLGDDDSTDNTVLKAQQFLSKTDLSFRIQSITDNPNQLGPKANVLDQLITLAEGEWLYVVDADSEINTLVFQEALPSLNNKTSVIYNGNLIQNLKGQRFESLDWMVFHAFQDSFKKEVPDAVMGNNVFLRKDQYQQIGGYKTIGFSVVEDLQLYEVLKKEFSNDFSFVNRFSENSINRTKATSSLFSLFQQRMRWMKGWEYLSIGVKAKFIGLFLISYLVLFLLFFFPQIVFLEVVAVGWTLHAFLKKYKNIEKYSLFQCLSYMVKMILFYAILPFSLLFVSEIKWKERSFK